MGFQHWCYWKKRDIKVWWRMRKYYKKHHWLKRRWYEQEKKISKVGSSF